MNLPRLNCLDTEFLDALSSAVLLDFHERRKCLNSVFWLVYQSLLNSERLLLLIDKPEDLEYLNYFFSRHNLQELCLLLNSPEDHPGKHILKKFTGTIAEYDVNVIDQDLRRLEYSLNRELNNIKNLHTGRLGKLNLIEANHILASRPKSEINIDTYRLFEPKEYRDKLELIERSSKLYRKGFQFNDRFQIFRIAVFREQKLEDIISLLKEFRIQVNELLEKCHDIESSIETGLENKFRDEQLRIKALIKEAEIIDDLKDKNTRFKKFEHVLYELSDLMSIARESSLEKAAELKNYKRAFDAQLIRTRDNILKESTLIYETLGVHSPEYDIGDIVEKTRSLREEMRQVQIFSKVEARFYTSFKYLKEDLHYLRSLLDKAIFFIEEEEDHLSWHLYMESLSEADRRLIQSLVEIEEDWISSFESAYVRDFVKNEIHGLDSVSDSYIPMLESYIQLEDLFSRRILSNYKRDIHKSQLAELRSAIDKQLDWKSYLKNSAEAIFKNFPLVIMDTNKYNNNASVLEAKFDKLICVNTVPEKLPDTLMTKSVFVNCESMNNSVKESLKACEHLEVPGVDFNVNRSLKYLNSSELHLNALFFAHGLKNLSASYRIFQTRTCSLISLWSAENNMSLLERLDSERIKEIFEDEERSLIPALFQDTNKKILVLCEDYLLDPRNISTVFKQRLFIEKLQMAGIELISIDNYRSLRYSSDEFNLAVKKILSKGEEKSILV